MMIASWFLLVSAAAASTPEQDSAVDSLMDSKMEQAMENEHHALSLNAHEKGKMVEIVVSAQSADAVDVSYELAVAGTSSTRHKGSTRLESGADRVLSRVSIPQHVNWCAVLDVKQGDGSSYTLKQGVC